MVLMSIRYAVLFNEMCIETDSAAVSYPKFHEIVSKDQSYSSKRNKTRDKDLQNEVIVC